MDLKTTTLDGKIMDVVSEKDYVSKWRMYAENPSIQASTAVEVTDSKGNEYILPFRNKTDDRPGIYSDGSIYFLKYPTSEESQYKKENLKIVDFSKAENINDFLDKNAQIREMETTVLTDIDSVFIPPMSSNDSPEMSIFKQAVASKRMDINKYAPRFGDNFLNDKRILKTNSITMNKLISMCNNFDIEAELILRDVNPDVPNPMGKEIRAILTGIGGENNDV